MTEIGTLLQDRYLIEKKIGAGGMGAVYLAVDQRFDNYVAIKETFYQDEEFGEAFEREARLLNALHHPVLPHVSDYFAENNNYFLVMQYIEGEDLSDILKLRGAFPIADVLRWTDQLLDALDYLHSQEPPIIHRDIKPHNLKLTTRGDIMLLDFGLAKLNSDDTTAAISVFGYSRTYSPLEQIQGTGTDARSDIFALGATVYHLLTGKPPVDAVTRAASIVNGKPDPLRLANEIGAEISLSIASVLNSALALNPENRFISAQAMRQALEFAKSEDAGETEIQKSGENLIAPVGAEEKENFPALAVFAAANGGADAGGAFENEAEPETHAVETEKVQDQSSPIFSTIDLDASPQLPEARENNRKSLLRAALAAALVLGLTTVWYFAARQDPSDQTIQAPVAAEAPKANTAREVSEKISPVSSSESVLSTKTKPEASEKTVEKRNVKDAETVADKASSDAGNDVPQPEKDAPENVENRERIVDEAEVTDASEVETVDQNRGNQRMRRKKENEARRNGDQIPDEMSEEEFEQLQRERKKKRRERRKNPISY